VVGVGADEALPERPLTMEESEEIVRSGGTAAPAVKTSGVSQAIVEGVPDCFYPLTRDIRAGYRYGDHVEWIKGERAAFGFFEVAPGFDKSGEGEHEQFYYVCDGEIDVVAGNVSKSMQPGDIVHMPRGVAYSLSAKGGHARFVGVRATDYLADRLDREPSS
jgi:mannose-6-phosphate isomerase-like protein (cupin superfamily)